MSKWIVKWANGPARLRTYFLDFNTSTQAASWTRRQKRARKFATRKAACAVADMWHGHWRPRVIRLVPKVSP